MTRLAALPGRAVLAVEGDDRVDFLQGLVSNDVTQVAADTAVWTALLTPQGKWLADFFILRDGDRLLLDVEREQAAMLATRLSRYRLRARVTIKAEPSLHVHAAWDGEPRVTALVARDPRLPEAGWRVISDQALPTTALEVDWDRHRLALGLPDGSRDLEADKSVLLEAGFDELSGVSWTKGCYMGQELTARTRYRGLVKRRLVPVTIEGTPPAPGTPVLLDGREVGTMRSSLGNAGMAVVRIEALPAVLDCGSARLRATVPAWMRVAGPAA